MLLGRVRKPSVGSLEALEMERPSPKIIKEDPLSVYETTLLKLREGSQRCHILPSEYSMSTDVSCVTASDSPETTDAGCSSTTYINCIGEQSMSMSSPNNQRSKTPSVLYLFSKYKRSKNDPRSPDEEDMLMETVSSSLSTSCSVSDSELTSCHRHQLSEDFESGTIKYLETSSPDQVSRNQLTGAMP